MTGYDDYRITTCSITGEECYRGGCSNCEVAKAKEQSIKYQYHKNILDFSSNKCKLYGVIVLTNKSNTMAVVRVGDYKQMQTNGLTGVEYSFGQYVKVQYPHFICLMNKMDLSPPTHVFKEKHQLGIFIYDDYVYFCAARIEHGVD